MTLRSTLVLLALTTTLTSCGSKDSAPVAAKTDQVAKPDEDKTAKSAVIEKPAKTEAAALPAAPPAVDLSGKWECLWTAKDGDNGHETWVLIQEGEALRVTLSGKDVRRYTGTMKGTIQDDDVQLEFTYGDRTHGTMSLRLAANGSILDGEWKNTRTKAAAHYGCSRS